MRAICTSGSMSEMWKRSYGLAIEAPPDERGGERLCETYCHRATSRYSCSSLLYAILTATGRWLPAKGDMRPRVTNSHIPTSDVYRVRFESAGALEFVNEYSGYAVRPLSYIAFAELEHARSTFHFSREEVSDDPATGN